MSGPKRNSVPSMCTTPPLRGREKSTCIVGPVRNGFRDECGPRVRLRAPGQCEWAGSRSSPLDPIVDGAAQRCTGVRDLGELRPAPRSLRGRGLRGRAPRTPRIVAARTWVRQHEPGTDHEDSMLRPHQIEPRATKSTVTCKRMLGVGSASTTRGGRSEAHDGRAKTTWSRGTSGGSPRGAGGDVPGRGGLHASTLMPTRRTDGEERVEELLEIVRRAGRARLTLDDPHQPDPGNDPRQRRDRTSGAVVGTVGVGQRSRVAGQLTPAVQGVAPATITDL